MKLSSMASVVGARVLVRPKPVAVGFEMTHLCNLACAYCDRHTPRPNEMTFEQILTALAGLVELGMKEISLDGGEALAHRHIDEVVCWLAEHDIEMRLNTNGILVPKRRHLLTYFSKLKISLDGPAEVHDAARGPRAFERAVRGVRVALHDGVPVELTCVLGSHNAKVVDSLLDIAASLGVGVIFQPARQSLFIGERGPGLAFRLEARALRAAFRRVEERKRAGAPVLNGWASLRHFRSFPRDTPLPCAAGWINVTLDPEGNLYHCGQANRGHEPLNVTRLGVRQAFERLTREGCGQCWCARVVEENYAWGGRFLRFLPILDREG